MLFEFTAAPETAFRREGDDGPSHDGADGLARWGGTERTDAVRSTESNALHVGGGWMRFRRDDLLQALVTPGIVAEDSSQAVSTAMTDVARVKQAILPSVLVQFTVDLRLTATLRRRARHYLGADDTSGTVEAPLPHPVVVRMSLPSAQRLLSQGRITDRDGRLPAPAQRADWHAEILLQEITDTEGEPIGVASFSTRAWAEREAGLRHLAKVKHYTEWRRDSGDRASRERPMPFPHRSRYFFAGDTTADGMQVVLNDGAERPLAPGDLTAIARTRTRLAKLPMDAVIVLVPYGGGPPTTLPGVRSLAQMTADATGLTVMEPAWGMTVTSPDGASGGGIHLTEGPDGSPGRWRVFHPGSESRTLDSGHAEEERSAAGAVAVDSSADRVAPVSRGTDGFAYDRETSSGPVSDEGARSPGHQHAQVGGETGSGSPRVPELVSPSPNAVPADVWRHRRAGARVARLETSVFDPFTTFNWRQRRNDRETTGHEVFIRAEIQRIEAVRGHWVRALTVDLPVRLGTGMDDDRMEALQGRMTELLDKQLNVGFVLPVSGDQLHIDVRFRTAPEHPEAVHISMTNTPGRSNQHNFALHAGHNDAEIDRDNHVLLHEILHYVGVTDRYHAPLTVFRRRIEQTDSFGLMASLTDPLPTDPHEVRLPGSYLAQIETATSSGPVIYDHPLDAGTSQSRSAARITTDEQPSPPAAGDNTAVPSAAPPPAPQAMGDTATPPAPRSGDPADTQPGRSRPPVDELPDYADATLPRYSAEETDADALAARWGVPPELVQDLARYGWFDHGQVDALRLEVNVEPGEPTEHLLHWIDSIGRIPTDLGSLGDPYQWTAADVYEVAGFVNADPRDLVEIMAVDSEASVEASVQHWQDDLAGTADLLDKLYGGDVTAGRALTWLFAVGAYHRLSPFRLRHLVYLMRNADVDVTAMTSVHEVDVPALEEPAQRFLSQWPVPERIVYRLAGNRLLDPVALDALLTELHITRPAEAQNEAARATTEEARARAEETRKAALAAAQTALRWVNTIGRIPTGLSALGGPLNFDALTVYDLAQSVQADPQHLMQVLTAESSTAEPEPEPLRRRLESLRGRFQQSYGRRANASALAWLFAVGAHHRMTLGHMHDAVLLLHNAGITPSTVPQDVDVAALVAEANRLIEGWRVPRDTVYELARRRLLDVDALESLLSDLAIEAGDPARDLLAWIGTIGRIPTDLAELGAELGLDAVAVYRLAQSVNADPQSVMLVIARGPRRSVQQWLQSLRQTAAGLLTRSPNVVTAQPGWLFQFGAQHRLGLAELDDALALMRGTTPLSPVDSAGALELAARARLTARARDMMRAVASMSGPATPPSARVVQWAGEWSVNGDDLGRLTGYEWFDAEAVAALRSELHVEGGRRTDHLLVWLHFIGRVPTDLAALGEPLGLDAATVYELAQSVMADPGHVMRVIAGSSDRAPTEWMSSLQATVTLFRTLNRRASPVDHAWLFQLGAHHELSLDQLAEILPRLDRAGIRTGTPVDDRRVTAIVARVTSESDTPTPPDQPSPRPAAAPPAGPLIPPPSRAGEAQSSSARPEPQRGDVRTAGPEQIEAARDAREQPPAEEELPGYSRAGNHVHRHANRWRVPTDIVRTLARYEWFDADRVDSLRSELEVEGGGPTLRLLRWINTIGRIPADLPAMAQPSGITPATVYELAMTAGADPRHVLQIMAQGPERTVREWMLFLSATRDHFTRWYPQGPPAGLARLFEVGSQFGLSLSQINRALQEMHLSGISFFSAELRQLVAGLAGQSTHAPGFTDQAPRAAVPSVHAVTTPQPPAPDVPEQQSGSDGPLPGYSPASDQVYRHAVRWFVSPRLVSRLTRYGWFDPHAVDTLRSELAPGTRTRHLLSWIEVIGRVPVNLADLGRPLDIDANDVFLLAEVASADPLHLSQVLRTRLDQIYPGHWFGVLSDLSNDFTRLHGEAADRRGLAWLFALSAHHGLGLLQLYDLMFLMAEESVPLSVGFEDEEVMRLVAGVTERPLRRKPSPVAPAAVTSAFQAHVPVAGPSRRPAASPSGADLSSVEEGPSGLAPAAGDVGSASGEAGPVLDLSVLGGGPWVSSVEEATGRRADDHSAPTVPDTGPTVEPADNTLPTGRQPDAHTIAPTENRAVGAIAGPSRRNTTADGADLPAPTPDAPTPAYPPAGPEHSESAETPPSYSPGTPPDYFRADNDADVLATRWDVSADVVRPLAPYQWFVPEAVDALRTQLGISQGGPTESLLIWIDAIGRIPTDLATAGESRNMNAASLYTLAASAGADPQDVLQLMSTDPDQTNRQWAEQLAYARDLFIRTYGEAAASPREIAWFFGVGAYHGLSLNRLLQLVHLMDYAQTPTLTPFEDVDVRELENLIGILTYWRLPPDLIQRFIRHRLLHTAPLLHGLLTDLNIERGQAATDFVEWADTIGRTPTDLRDLAVRHSVDPANLYRLAQSANADPQHIMQIFASDPEMTAAQWDFFDARVYDIGIRFSERFPSRPSDPRDSAWLFRLGAHHGLTATRLYDVLPLLAQAGIAPGTPVEQVDVRALEADVAERYARWQEEWDGRRQREASARERIRRLQERWDLRWAEHVPEIYAGYHWFDTDAVDALLSDLGVERGQQATDFVSWIGYIDRVPTDLAALGAPVGLDAAAVYRLSYSVNSDPQHVTQVIARGPERTVPQWMESLRQTTEQYRTLYPHFWSESESWAFAVAAHYGLSLDQLNRMLPLLHEAGLGPDDDPDDEGIARLMARARGRRPAPDGPASESDVSSLDESRSVSPRLPAAAPPAPPLNLSSSGADGSDSGISPAVEGLVDLSSVAGGPTGVPSTFSVSAEVSGQLVGRDRDPDAGPLAGPSGGTPARPAAGSAQTGSYEALPGYTAANTDAVGAAGRWLVHPGFVRPLARYEWFDPEAVDVLRSVLGVAPGGPTAGLLQWIQAIGRIPTELLDPEQPLGLQARTLFDLSLTAGADPHYVLQVMARGPVVPVEQWRQLLQRARAEFQRHYATHRFGSEWLFAVGASHDLSLAQLRALIPVLRGTGFGPGTSVQDEDLRWLLDLQTGRQPAHLPAPAAPAAAVGGGEPGISRAVGEPVDLSSVEGGPAGISFTSPGSFDVSSGAGQPSGFAPASVEEGPSGLAPAAGDVGSASGEAGPVLDLSVLAGDPWIASVEEATGRRADDRPSAPTTSDTRPTMEPADNTPAGDDTPVTDQQPTTNTTGSTENAPAGPGGAPLRRRPAVRHRPGVGRRQQPPATSDAAAETTADTRTTPAPTVLDPVPARPSMPRRRAVPSGHVPAQPVGPAAGDAPQISSTSRRDGTGEPASDAPAGRPNSDGITPASPHSSRPAGGDVPREGSPAVTPQPEHVAVPQPRSGYRRTSPDTAELHGTSLVLLEVPESGGRLTGPLLSALSSVAPHAVHETGVDSLSAFTAWLAQRVTDDDVTDSTSPQVDSERAIPLRLLVDAGVALTEGQRTHAVLVGNALRGSEVTLTPANRARLLLLDPSYAREQRTIAEFMALLLPVVAARELGVRIALVNRRGDVLYFGRPHASHRGHGSHDGEPVAVVVEDDDRYLAGLSAP
ncbi:hypothetical protein ABZ770_16525 [Streptomyces sp. NPDC006654]|uniref:hypothetical protein n=1 Tax=Streptomyces sp. NPDC006654 TaxID=3156897 RepID=UPI0033CB8472